MNVIVCDSSGFRDVSFSLYVRFRTELPELMNFIDGVSVVRMKPGFIVRISVDVSLVSSLIIVSRETLNSFDIVVDWSISTSL